MGYVGGKLAPWFDAGPVDTFMRAAPVAVASEGREIAEKNTPIETGELRAAWKSDKKPRRSATYIGIGWEASWMNELEYAPYVNYGTGLFGPEGKKYLILPKKPGGTLHWVNKATGQDVFAKSVLHPGSPGNYMLEISADFIEATWDKVLRPLLRVWERQMERQNPYAKVT
jgi:hypothetical protein